MEGVKRWRIRYEVRHIGKEGDFFPLVTVVVAKTAAAAREAFRQRYRDKFEFGLPLLTEEMPNVQR